jgi:hypothetical protein
MSQKKTDMKTLCDHRLKSLSTYQREKRTTTIKLLLFADFLFWHICVIHTMGEK